MGSIFDGRRTRQVVREITQQGGKEHMRILKIINTSTMALQLDGSIDDVINEIELTDNDTAKIKGNELTITTKYDITGCVVSMEDR